MNDKGICKTAPATPGLLNTIAIQSELYSVSSKLTSSLFQRLTNKSIRYAVYALEIDKENTTAAESSLIIEFR